MRIPPNSLTALVQRTAVFAGALTALVSLASEVRLHVACLRGAGAWLAALVLGRVLGALLQLSLRADQAQRKGGNP
jgi:hypothetical protein